MSLPRYKITMLALSMGVASVFVGCSSNPSKDVVDTGPKSTEQGYFDNAQHSLERGRYIEAAENLEAIDTYFPTGPYAQQAQLELIYTKFQQKEFDKVVSMADRFIRLNPQHPNVDYAYYVRGVANMEQNYDSLLRYTSLQQSHRDVSYLKVAYQNFVDFLRRFPSSQYAVDAAQRMAFINQELAESEMNVARYNVKRGAWLAAAERAQWVVEYFPQTPQIPEALATLAYSYNKLGDKAAAAQYIELLKINYPDLVKGNTVNLKAARHDGNWINRMTLGVLGRNARSTVAATQPSNTSRAGRRPAAIEEEPSWINRLSLGLLDKPDTVDLTRQAQLGEQFEQRSWLNRLSLGLLDQPNMIDLSSRSRTQPAAVTLPAQPVPESNTQTPASDSPLSNIIQERKPHVSLDLPDQSGAQPNN